MILVMLFALCFGASFAQQGQKGQGMKQGARKGEGRGVFRNLNLTQEQRQQLKPIMEETRTQIQTVRNDQSLTNEQKRVRIQEIHKASRVKMQGILTAEQMQQLNEARTPGSGTRQRQKTRAKMVESLNLTPAQQQRVNEIFNNNAAQVRAIRQNQSLSEEDKKKQVQEIRKSMHSGIKQILTPEQLQKFEEKCKCK